MTNAAWANISFNYKGASVLITGGTSGIGAGIAAAYRAAGAEVTITGTRASAKDYDEDIGDYRYLQLDVERADDIARVAAAVPKLDILINNGGFALPSQGIDEYEPENFERAVRMLLTGVYRMSHACADKISRSALPGGGSIIGIGSMASYFGIEIVPGYGAAKSGLLGLTRTLAIHWGKSNIRVNAVAAGLTESRMTATTIANPAWSEPTLARTPLGRIGTPHDVAGAVLFLTSAAASHITGQTVPVDGGYTVYG